MKKASPSTRSVSSGRVGSVCVESRASTARMWACATLPTYVKSNRLSLCPSWKRVCRLASARSMLGMASASPSPMMPAGRSEAVSMPLCAERLAARTRASASACARVRWTLDVFVCAGGRRCEERGEGEREWGKTNLRLPVVLFLRLPPHARPSLVGIDQVADGVVHHARAARVHECLDALQLLRALDYVPRPVYVHFPEQRFVVDCWGQGGGVDDDGRLDLLEDFSDRR